MPKPPMELEKVRWTTDELREAARRRFGDDYTRWAFICPQCGDVATVQDFKDVGRVGLVGQECLGRSLGALDKPVATNTRGCDWAAYGLFPGPWVDAGLDALGGVQ